MKLLVCLLFILQSLALALPSPAIQYAHKTTHKIEVRSVQGGWNAAGSCSATAVAPHALLTAQHCVNAATDIITIDDKEAHVAGIYGDMLDHVIVLVSDYEFKAWADVVDDTTAPGDEVFIFGNPGSFNDMFRHGYVSGYNKKEDNPLDDLIGMLRGKTPKKDNTHVRVTYYDFNGFFGDSGTAIFNSDGKIVGVTGIIVSDEHAGYQQKYMGGYELRMNAQLQLAKQYTPPAKR